MTEKILFVDDDPNALSAHRRDLHRTFDIETAESGEAGLEILASHGPFALVIADMRMPGMDGVQFLARVREAFPDTVRMMLTGQADMQSAIDAVNRGFIFRFLLKPCPPETLTAALNAGLEQFRLIMAERELLEKTLVGSVKMLADMLSIANPAAFSRAARVRRLVTHVARELKLADPWQLELAASLC
jgi:DNA-binding NtrC family response regulator